MVCFKSLTLQQTVTLCITNNWDRPIIFKMKTTRPLLFKMRPVFGLIHSGQEQTIRLSFKGFKDKEKPPCSRDRFTCVVAPAPPNCTDPCRTWKQQKCPEVLTQTARKVLRIDFGEPDRSKLVSVRPKHIPKTEEQLEYLRKEYPDLPENIIEHLPVPDMKKSPSKSPQKVDMRNEYLPHYKNKKAKEMQKEKEKKSGGKKQEESSSSSSSSSEEEK